jgi:hypothetical protein
VVVATRVKIEGKIRFLTHEETSGEGCWLALDVDVVKPRGFGEFGWCRRRACAVASGWWPAFLRRGLPIEKALLPFAVLAAFVTALCSVSPPLARGVVSPFGAVTGWWAVGGTMLQAQVCLEVEGLLPLQLEC